MITAETYRSISEYFFGIFHEKVRKIAINAGTGCPGRCAYCNNAAFSPSYTLDKSGKDDRVISVTEQLERGVAFNGKKVENAKYLAYFQSYTSTLGNIETLKSKYEEALAYPDVVGLVIATRPDCLSVELLDWFEERFSTKQHSGNKPFLLVELGVESTIDSSLEKVHRGHDWDCSRKAIIELDRRGIAVGAHLILGLPGETQEDFLLHARRLSQLPVSTLKLHQLQIIRGTEFELLYNECPEIFNFPTAEQYAETLAAFLKELRRDIALDRFVSESPRNMVIAPAWGIKPEEFTRLLKSRI